ncbi:chaperonin 10-like protein [Bisporella sp. PMI_857]|nr:chaperonin 10-like protein [Bisporella sp. PMI_857]
MAYVWFPVTYHAALVKVFLLHPSKAQRFYTCPSMIEPRQGYRLAIEARELPEPGPSEVLIRLSASGVCGTDIALAAGKIRPQHRILGHGSVGRVVRLWSAVPTTQVPLRLRVGLHSGRAIDGTFAEYTAVPYRDLMPITEYLLDKQIAPIICAGVTIYKAVKICGATPGQWILISGAGGCVGGLGIQYAKAMGYHVIASDIGKAKKFLCMHLGAEV